MVKVGYVYKNLEEKKFYTPAQSGNFYVCDMWECDKSGFVKDIEENPYPVPKYINDLKLIGKSKFKNEYPETTINNYRF